MKPLASIPDDNYLSPQIIRHDLEKVDIEELAPQLKLAVHGGNHFDNKTQNDDFIKMRKILRAQGIKNYSFHLKVYDKDLIGVDPFDPSLSGKMKRKIIHECTINFWYFAREIIRFPAPGGHIPCMLNLGNMAYYFCKLMCIDVALEMPRQFGKTGGELVFIIWSAFFVIKNSEIGMFNKSSDNTTKELANMKTIIRNMPTYLKIYDPDNPKTGNNNKESIDMYIRDVKIRILLSSKNPMDANSKGRGFSLANVNGDEACFIPQFKQFYLGLRPAMSKQVELAKKQRTIYGCTLSTTSGTTLVEDQKFFKESILDTSAKFTVHLFDFTKRRQILEYMARNTGGSSIRDRHDSSKKVIKSTYIYIRYDYNQLGKGIEYLRAMESELLYDEDAINKDIKLRWVDYSKSSPYKREHIARLQNYIVLPIHTIMIDDYYPLEFFTHVTDWDFPYMLSVDVSTGQGGTSDSSVILIHDPRTLEIVAQYKSNLLDIPQLTFLVKEIATKLFTGACICVEVNGPGSGIVSSLAYDDDIKKRLYHEKVDDALKRPKQWHELLPAHFGFVSSDKNGKMGTMYKQIVAHAIEDDYAILRSEDLMNQIGNLEKNAKNGKIKAAYGKHKDVVSSFVIGRFALLHSETIGNWIPLRYIRSIELDSGTIITDNVLKKNKRPNHNLLSIFSKSADTLYDPGCIKGDTRRKPVSLFSDGNRGVGRLNFNALKSLRGNNQLGR